ncbi:MAG: 4-(cytidine 5'-diphospho)-2-C-methyl-D-erythritol kinase [Thermomicrobiales bacterium]
MPLELLAPAKLNLGLEVLGRRDDGYHEVSTILATVSLFDRLAFSPSADIRLTVEDAELDNDENLVVRAARLLRRRSGVRIGAAISLTKRIPAAAGLGGASSDAAAALLGLCMMWRLTPSREALAELALELGSDVPFFLRGGVAHAGGRGERLSPLPRLRSAGFVILGPSIVIPGKTATLYGLLEPSDFSTGAQIQESAALLADGNPSAPLNLANAFQRPLLDLRPDLRESIRDMTGTPPLPFALSGAGPAHFVMTKDARQASAAAHRLRAVAPRGWRVIACRPCAGPFPLARVRAGH